jgi:hypothetical protein
MEAEVEDMVTVEAPAVTVPPASERLPATAWVASASVTVPERVRFWSVLLFEVRVPEPDITSVFPALIVTVLQFVKFTLPEAVQVPDPLVRLFPVPALQVRFPVIFTVGLFAAPVSVTSPVPDSAMSRFPEKVWVPAAKVTVRPAVLPELSTFTLPP